MYKKLSILECKQIINYYNVLQPTSLYNIKKKANFLVHKNMCNFYGKKQKPLGLLFSKRNFSKYKYLLNYTKKSGQYKFKKTRTIYPTHYLSFI
tara:strand:+ start:178 stop:459 length:282 start_codon:yes stop_codon:yes gene_type:complete